MLSTALFVSLGAPAAIQSARENCTGELRLTRVNDREYPICILSGAALSQEFFEKDGDSEQPQALEAYTQRKKSDSRMGGVCGTFAAELIVTKDRQNETYNLCYFEDGSYIDETTLWLGPGSNEDLDKEIKNLGDSKAL